MFKLIGTNEILGAFASSLDEDEQHAIINDIEAEVITVENTDDEVHLALPYYSGVEDAIAKAISDTEANDVAGGEIGIAIAIALGVLSITSLGAGMAVEKAVKSRQGKK